MRKTLVLVRHGKAVSGSATQDDFERELSEAGKRSLEASLPHSLSLLDAPDKEVKVVSSPAPRAMQTAVLVEKALRGAGFKTEGGVSECGELWYQDIDGFMGFLSCCKEQTVFAVGHNPFVDNLIEQLTGANLPCATGSMTCIALGSPATCRMAAQGSYENRLLWFAQGPVSQKWKTLVNIEGIMRDCADEMLKRRDAFFADPDDIETMHKLRVSIRTLRSLTAFLKPWQSGSQNSQLQYTLKTLVAHTSRLRELDVFAEQTRESEGFSEELAAFCEGEARAERERVAKVLASKQCARDFKKAASLARNVKWKRPVSESGLPAITVRDRFDAMVADLESELADLKLSEVERTHDIRKRAKRARYVAENFKGILGEDAVDIAKGMTAHQDNLGAICDARVNIELINAFLQRDLPERVEWDLNLLRAQNETFLYSALKANE